MKTEYRIYSYRPYESGFEVYSTTLNGEDERFVYAYQNEAAALAHAMALNNNEAARYAAAIEAEKKALESLRNLHYTNTPADYYACSRYCGD